MSNDNCVYFIGAGASKQDRFPLTDELKHGIAWSILKEPARFELLLAHLRYLYNVQDAMLEESGRIWEDLRKRADDEPQTEVSQVPEVTDLLSTLDWMIRDQSSFGPGLRAGDVREAAEVSEVRDLVVQALCYCLGTYCSVGSASTTCEFIKLVQHQDTLVTTNWDLLLDAARDNRFGSKSEDYGTSGNVELEGASKVQLSERPKLLKLHGSLSWRYCPRCQRLEIDPHTHVAGDRTDRPLCLCTCRFSELIVTPGFVREYRNLHLLNIWNEALLAMAKAAHWVFIGYSLPMDDVGVRTLLLKARCMRHDLSGDKPCVTIVTGKNHREETLACYRGILPQAKLYPEDFGHFVRQGGATTTYTNV